MEQTPEDTSLTEDAHYRADVRLTRRAKIYRRCYRPRGVRDEIAAPCENLASLLPAQWRT